MAASPGYWRIGGGRAVALARPLVLGVLNVTPDSFSDGGRHATVDAALRRVDAMLAEGADMIDVGGQSTRPHVAELVPVAEELQRTVPVIDAIRTRFPSVVLSIDTVRSEVAIAALETGAAIVNDVSAMRLDPAMADAVAAQGAGIVLMHSRGGVHDMATYAHAEYGRDVVGTVIDELEVAVGRATAAGVPRDAIVLDPGVGFAKMAEHSLAVLHGVDRLAGLGFPVMVGASRKRFVGTITNVAEPEARTAGTVGAHVAALGRGARLFRVHDVAAARQSLDVAWAVLAAGVAA